MVNHGVSKGCANCKRRRKKCDETRPACENCVRNHLVCPGYVSKIERVFRQYQPVTTAVPPRLAPIAPFESLDLLPDILKPNIEERALALFYSQWTVQSRDHAMSRGYLDGLEALVAHAGPTSDLARAVRMMAFQTLGRQERQPLLVEKGMALYSSVLRSFAATIADEKASRSMEALVVCVLLGFYEMVAASAESEDNLSSHGAHATGVMGILRTGNRAYEILQRGNADKLENPLRSRKIKARGGNHGLLGAPLSDKSSTAVGADVLAQQTWELLLRVEGSSADAKVVKSDLRRLLAGALELKESYDRWPKSQPRQWDPKVIGTMGKSNRPQARHPLSYPGNLELYFDLYVATVYVMYRKGLLLQHLMIYHLTIRLDDAGLAQEAKAEAHHTAECLISALPYLLLEDPYALVDKNSPPVPTPGKAIGGMLVLHPLFMASTLMTELDENLSRHISKVLQWIGTEMGIGQGLVLAKANKLAISRRYLSDAHVIVWAGMILQPF